MIRRTLPLLRAFGLRRWNPMMPQKIVDILDNSHTRSLKEPENVALMDYFLSIKRGQPQLSVAERRYVVKFLYKRRAYSSVVNFSRRYLFLEDTHDKKFREDVEFEELNKYLKSLAIEGKWILLDQVMTTVIAQFSIQRKDAVTDLINSVFVLLSQECKKAEIIDHTEPVIKWVKWIRLLNGHCTLNSYTYQKKLLKTFLFFFRESRVNESAFFIKCLENVKAFLGAATASQFATTLIYLSRYDRNFPLVEDFWNYKIEKNLTIVSSDLTCILQCYCHFKKYDLVEPTHSAFPSAHDQDSQFDYLLIAHAKRMDWKSLQDQFNALFGIGNLPDINQYGVVMYALAKIGDLESVEKLYAQLLRREMIPTYAVLQSLLYVHYKTGDLHGCFAQFELFERFSIQPSSSTYTLMFKVYRGLNNIDGALRLLKRITETDVERISETYFALLIQMCANFTNQLIAQELFHIMIDHYNISPTGKSVAALMDVYIESQQPQRALSLFKKQNIQSADRISVFNKAIKAHIAMGNQAMCEVMFRKIVSSKLETNAEFFTMMLKYLVWLKKDYEAAENVLEQLEEHPTVKIDVSHFEIVMDAYDHISLHEGVYRLYKKMNDKSISVNSKVIYYLIRATFKVQMKSQGDLEQSINLLDRVMTNAADRTLDITFGRLHPSIIAWPMRVVAKYYNPMKALDLLNRYNSLFYGKEDMSSNNKFNTMRSLLVVTAETEQWDDFDSIFEKFLSRIEAFQKQPSATVKNLKLRSLFVGLLSYKIRHLDATQSIQSLPDLLRKLEAGGFIIDNFSWNQAVRKLFQDSRTIETGLQAVNEKLIHGYNLIHKYRLLKRHAQESSISSGQPWLLRQKKRVPYSFQPTLYLNSKTYSQIMEYMDRYLNSLADLNHSLQSLIVKYPYFMKSYLMHPRSNVHGWDKVEADHAPYLLKLRSTKRIVAGTKF